MGQRTFWTLKPLFVTKWPAACNIFLHSTRSSQVTCKCVCVQFILRTSIPSMGNKHGLVVIQKDNVTLRQRHSCQPLSSVVAPANPTNVTTNRSCWSAYTQRNQNVVINSETSEPTNQGTFKVKVISARQEKELSMDCNSFFKERKHLWRVQLFQQASWTVWL